MARINEVRMKGVILSDPKIIKDEETNYARTYMVVARDYRRVDNGIHHMETDRPFVITTEPFLVEEMEKVNAGDIVDVKGVVVTRMINKTSFCANCNIENKVPGMITFVTPMFIEKCGHVDSLDECQEYLSRIRPISNNVDVYGRLTRDPKKISPKNGLTVTQYQIGVKRNYKIKDDPPEIDSDYPWIKTYGKMAEEDRCRLKEGSIVRLDAYLQTRNVQRYTVCPHCGTKYYWKDKAMEIVPYDIEYVRDYRSDEEIEELKASRLKSSLAQIFGNDDDLITDDDIIAGMDDYSSGDTY